MIYWCFSNLWRDGWWKKEAVFPKDAFQCIFLSWSSKFWWNSCFLPGLWSSCPTQLQRPTLRNLHEGLLIAVQVVWRWLCDILQVGSQVQICWLSFSPRRICCDHLHWSSAIIIATKSVAIRSPPLCFLVSFPSSATTVGCLTLLYIFRSLFSLTIVPFLLMLHGGWNRWALMRWFACILVNVASRQDPRNNRVSGLANKGKWQGL